MVMLSNQRFRLLNSWRSYDLSNFMDYFFNDHLRWNLGWDTPNQAGAFLVSLLPWMDNVRNLAHIF